MSPHRPRLEEARRAIEGVSDTSRAWERLAERGVIPRKWLGDPLRKFTLFRERGCTVCHGDGRGSWVPGEDLGPADCGRCDGTGIEPFWTEPSLTPPDLEACVMFASDPEGVTAAEHMAREYNLRLRDWGVAKVSSITWRVDGPPLSGGDPVPWQLRQLLARAARQDPELQSEAKRVRYLVEGEEFSSPVAYREAAEHAAEATLLEALRLRDARVEGPPNMSESDLRDVYPPAILGKRLADLPSLYEPLLRIWSLGYVLGSTQPEGIILHAPRPGGSSP